MMLRNVRWAVAAAMAAVALVVVPVGGARAELKPPVVAVVDIQFILHESSAGKGVLREISEQEEKLRKVVESQRATFAQTDQELARQRSVLSEEAFTKKRHDFEKQVMDSQRDIEAKKKSIDQGINEAMVALQKATFEIIAGMAQERGINMVVQRQQVVIADKTMDMTQEVLDRLNSKLSSVPVKIPPVKK